MNSLKSPAASRTMKRLKASEKEESIGLLLSRCLNRVNDVTDASLLELDLNTPQLGVLHAISRGRATTPSALARLCFTNSAAITYTLDLLEKKEFLVRKNSTTDRRVIELELTKKGEALVERCIPKAVAAQSQVLRPLDQTDTRLLRTLLQRIANQN